MESSSDAAIARALMRDERTAALATLQSDGAPFASFVTIASAPDGSPLLLLSRLAVHSRNLERDTRASLLLVREAPSEKLATTRVTLTGRLLKDSDPGLKRIYIEQQPDAARYAGFADFSPYKFHTEAGHLVAGFGRIVDLDGSDLFDHVNAG